MTRVTALLIAAADEDGDLIIGIYEPVPRLAGFEIGTLEESPSGAKWLRPLLTSKPVYCVPAHAFEMAKQLVAATKDMVAGWVPKEQI